MYLSLSWRQFIFYGYALFFGPACNAYFFEHIRVLATFVDDDARHTTRPNYQCLSHTFITSV
jgi:hypothetical protein